MTPSLPQSFQTAVKRLVRRDGHTHAEIAAAVARMAPAAHAGRPPRIPLATVEHIRALAKQGVPASELARQFNIHVSHVRLILRGLARRVR